jgi:hypothetical protein
MRPDVAETCDCVRVKEHPESLTGFDILSQKRIDDPNVMFCWSDQLHVVRPCETDVSTGRKSDRRRNRCDGHMDSITSAIAVFDALAQLRNLFHVLVSPLTLITKVVEETYP